MTVGSVALAWASVHTVFTTRYARIYYTGPDEGVDFNEDDPPRYSDFAYLAFTIGMTFQVSDTDLKTKEVRATAFKHALLSYPVRRGDHRGDDQPVGEPDQPLATLRSAPGVSCSTPASSCSHRYSPG